MIFVTMPNKINKDSDNNNYQALKIFYCNGFVPLSIKFFYDSLVNFFLINNYLLTHYFYRNIQLDYVLS